jgi:hypothetical protein
MMIRTTIAARDLVHSDAALDAARQAVKLAPARRIGAEE